MRTRKTKDLFVVQGNYGHGHGWEDLTASYIRNEAKDDLRAYQKYISNGTYRLITRREKITNA